MSFGPWTVLIMDRNGFLCLVNIFAIVAISQGMSLLINSVGNVSFVVTHLAIGCYQDVLKQPHKIQLVVEYIRELPIHKFAPVCRIIDISIAVRNVSMCWLTKMTNEY